MTKTHNLPYIHGKSTKENLILANFLLRKFRPRIKEKFPKHYLFQPIPHKTLEFIKEKSKTHLYFLRFDIRKYYPSICHQTLTEKIPEIYEKMSTKTPSRRMKRHLKNILPLYLKNSPYNKGISTGSRLSYVLAGIFLLDLDLEIPYPFLRQVDDYLVFCKNKKEPEKILREIITPKLNELGLEINEKKLKSGKFHKDKVDFIGFDFYAGYFSINEAKKEEFKKRIVSITHLAKKKPKGAVIKTINNKILGFAHYYKFASCKKDFGKLDAFIRMRLRRYIGRNKDSKNKERNLFLKNSTLKGLGLKSLVDICSAKKKSHNKTKKKYGHKNWGIFKKEGEIKEKTGQSDTVNDVLNLEQKARFYEQKLILKEIKNLTDLVAKLEKRVKKLEEKL